MTVLPPPIYIDDDAGLAALMPQLLRAPLLAVDTESNSLHAYRERVCLIQISTAEADYILDPLSIGDLGPLATVFASPKIEKVFHAAEYDLMCLKRDFGFDFNHLFDTMLAARVCGIRQVGLNALLQTYVGVELDKSHQRDDWGQRPLPADSLRYAQTDTHYLPTLRDHLAQRLAELDRVEEAAELFEDTCRVRMADHQFDPEGYWRIAQPNHVFGQAAAILRELYLWRNVIAERRDVPPFKVLGDRTLVELAQRMPRTLDELGRISGMGTHNVRRYGHDLLRLIAQGSSAEPPRPPQPEPAADPRVVDLYSALREWRRDRAAQRAVESDVILAREVLWTLAQTMPTTSEALAETPGLGPWRLAQYGDELLAVIARFAPKKRSRGQSGNGEC